MKTLVAVALSVTVVTAWAAAPSIAAPDPSLAPAARPVAGCPTFPSNNYWHADISDLPQHPRSDAWMRHMSPRSKLHPDFGPSYGEQRVPYGIPSRWSDGPSQSGRSLRLSSESDRVRYPLGPTPDRGRPGASGDRHAIIVDRPTARSTRPWTPAKMDAGGRVRRRVGSGSNALRRDGWTSADAAGLPILPGLLRWAEVKAGNVDHAVRFTTDVTDRRYIWPARHQAGMSTTATSRRWARGFDSSLHTTSAGTAGNTNRSEGACKVTGWCLQTTVHPGTSRATQARSGREGSSPSSSKYPLGRCRR